MLVLSPRRDQDGVSFGVGSVSDGTGARMAQSSLRPDEFAVRGAPDDNRLRYMDVVKRRVLAGGFFNYYLTPKLRLTNTLSYGSGREHDGARLHTALQYMMDHAKEMGLGGVLPAGDAAERQLYTTFLASAFRSLRFGLNDAHGKGMAVQFNYLSDHGGFVQSSDGTFAVDLKKIKQAVTDLDHVLLTIEAEGDYAGAKKLLDEMGVVRPNLKKVLDGMQDIPTDIEPIFVTANELAPQS